MKKKKVKIIPQKYVYQGSPYNAYKNTRKNKLNEMNKDNNTKKGMRSLSKNVYQGSKINENKGLEEINM